MKIAKRNKSPQEYLAEPYARVLTPNGANGFTAEILEFPGCVTEGDTPEEAIQNLEEAALGWIEGTLEQGNPIPPPMNTEGYSGKYPLRLPKSVHREAARLAERNKVSLNTYLVTAIAEKVGAENSFQNQIKRELRQILAEQFSKNMLVVPSSYTDWEAGESELTTIESHSTTGVESFKGYGTLGQTGKDQ